MNQYKFSRTDSKDYPEWLSEFANELEGAYKQRTAVEVARQRQESEPSIYNQMAAILNGNKPIYSSVAEAVADYKKRTGLEEYQKRSSAQKAAKQILEASEKVSMAEEVSERPKVFEKVPAIENFIHNMIETSPTVQLPAILHSIAEVFRRQGITQTDLDDWNLARYINNILAAKTRRQDLNDANLGRGVGVQIDNWDAMDGNRNPFSGLMPSRVF